MKSYHLSIAALKTLLAAVPLSAQRPGSVELGGYAAYPIWDNALVWENKVGFGGQFVPSLREATKDGKPLDAVRYGGFVAVDVPIFKF